MVAALQKRTKIIVTDVPVSIREAVDAHGQQHDLSRNQVVIEALAERFRLTLPAAGDQSKYRPLDLTREGHWSLEVPLKIRTALRVEAARKGATMSGYVRHVLAEKFGLADESPLRKPRGSRFA